jgi:hypothetical protein
MADAGAACPEWQDDLAGWLMAQLGPDREQRLVEHLEGCAACRAEADSLLAVAAVTLGADPEGTEDSAGIGDGRRLEGVPGAGPETPSPSLGARIERAVRAERRAGRRARWAGAALVGAAAAARVLFVAGLVRDDGPDRVVGQQVAFTVVPEGASASAVIGRDGDGTVVGLQAEGLDPSATFAVWLTPPGGGWADRVPAGTFRPGADGRVDVRLSSALPADRYGRLWVTTPDGQIALDTE